MSVRKLKKKVFTELVDSLISSTKVFGIQSKADRFDFGELKSAKDLRLDYDVSLQPPKKYFLPVTETLLEFDRQQQSLKSVHDNEPFVLIGVHPYDMIAINQMDKLFSQDHYDTHYMTRRNNATVIACDVVNASENVFAASMGTEKVTEGYDVLLTDIGDCYVAQAGTDKGEKLLEQASQSEAAGQEDLKERERIWAENKEKLNKHDLKCSPSDLPKLLDKAYDHPVWEELARTCFACGSCNLVCPTCYCFDIQDDVDWDMKKGRRSRAWDGCLLAGFTRVAGDHEFRGNKADRIRHRIYRKGKYVPSKIGGEIACVGCGRCVSACLPDIANPVAIYNRLIEDIGIE